jgi:hypothetical protein
MKLQRIVFSRLTISVALSTAVLMVTSCAAKSPDGHDNDASGLVEPGAMVMFTSDHANTTAQNAFMRMQQQEGVHVAKKGDQWLVTITDLQLPNQDVMNQKTVTISGTLTCTHLING